MQEIPPILLEPHDAFRARRRFGSLDGIRAFAILGVVFHHSGDPLESVPLTQYGFLGVDAFFVMSGFLIVTLILREREVTGTISIKKFWARRALRIFPLYYAVLLLLTLIYGLLRPDSDRASAFFGELPFYVTYTSNWVHTVAFGIAWSLATEEQFYLVWPALERWAPKLVPVALAVGIVVSQLVNFGPLRAPLESAFGIQYAGLEVMQATFTPILLGVGLAHLLHRRQGFELAARLVGPRWTPWLFGFLVVALSSIGGDIAGWPRLSIQLALALLVTSVVIREDHSLAWLLEWSPIARLGVVSYGVYLLHLFPIGVVQKVQDRLGIAIWGVNTFFGLLITWGIAELSYRYFETPFLKLKGRFASGVGAQERGGKEAPEPALERPRLPHGPYRP